MQLAIIIGSTRPNRVGPSIAQWVLDLIKADQSLQSVQPSIVDLASFRLPLFDEPKHPMMIKDLEFTNPANTAWNKEIAKYNAYILVSPEYHSGIPGALKNSIDLLFHAWLGKPVMILTYGIFGGLQASQQLRQVLGVGCRMKVADSAPMLEFPGRNEQENNTSPALFQAMSGVIRPETFAFWEKEKDNILAGCHELLSFKEA